MELHHGRELYGLIGVLIFGIIFVLWWAVIKEDEE